MTDALEPGTRAWLERARVDEMLIGLDGLPPAPVVIDTSGEHDLADQRPHAEVQREVAAGTGAPQHPDRPLDDIVMFVARNAVGPEAHDLTRPALDRVVRLPLAGEESAQQAQIVDQFGGGIGHAGFHG